MGAGPPRLRVALDEGLDIPPFSVVVRDGEARGAPRGLVSAKAQGLLERVGDIRITGGGEQLILTWYELPEPKGVQAGLKFLVELVGARSEGAFR